MPRLAGLLIACLGVGLGASAGLGLALVASASRASPDASPSASVRAFMPRPARGPRGPSTDRLDRNDECINCHADIAAEWTHSLHRQAYEDPMVQAAFEGEADPTFCRTCHAPESDPRAEPSPRAAAAGVGCVTCHLDGRDDVILAGPSSSTSSASSALAAVADPPHPIRRTPAFASPDACAGCHEFWFPSAGRGGRNLKMQRTVSEHERSDHADTSCQGCHMPATGSGGARHLAHGFAVAGQPQVLRSALTVLATRPEPGRVVLELSPNQVGHAVPTGDLFRRLRVELRSAEPGSSWADERILTRQFGAQRAGPGHVTRVELDDDRVGVGRGPRVVEFTVPPELHDGALRWEIALERALDASRGAALTATVWDRTAFVTGAL